jgi:hypothetical protein
LRSPARFVQAALLLAACSRGPEPVHVATVVVAEGALAGPLGEAGIDEGTLQAAARNALRAAGFRLGDGTRPHRAVLSVPSIRLVPAGAEVTVEFALAPLGPGQPTPRRELAAAALPIAGVLRPRDAWLGALGKAAERAAEGLALGVAADDKPAPGLLADLTAGDARVRDHAIRVLGDRRDPAAVPILVRRMKEEDPRVAQRIVAALAQIGDERAIPALIDFSSGADPGLTLRMVRYIGDIGGAEAEGFLLTLESGHPDARVRTAARESLEDMSARAREAPVAVRK